MINLKISHFLHYFVKSQEVDKIKDTLLDQKIGHFLGI